MSEIKFDRAAHFGARGRNGYLTATGIAIFDMGNGDFAEIHLHPLTGRGRISEACRIPIRKSAIPAVIAELQKLTGEAA
jgi:hypothetical protein